MNRFNLNSVVGNLLMANIVMFLMILLLPQYSSLYDGGALWSLNSGRFEPYQLLTYMFLHADMSHLFFNMFALWMFGRQIEYDLGRGKFLFYYVFTGIGAGLFNLLVMYLIGDVNLTIGASGAVYGLLLAFGILHPNERLMLLFFPVLIKAKYFVMIFAALAIIQGLFSHDNVAHFAHLGGMIFGAILLLWWKSQRTIRLQ